MASIRLDGARMADKCKRLLHLAVLIPWKSSEVLIGQRMGGGSYNRAHVRSRLEVGAVALNAIAKMGFARASL
jgi:hypothetical protein